MAVPHVRRIVFARLTWEAVAFNPAVLLLVVAVAFHLRMQKGHGLSRAPLYLLHPDD
jgi:hypothetical protein